MFGIKALLILVGWIAVLCVAYTTALKLPEKSAHIPASLAWNMFALFLMFAIVSAVLRKKNRGFWTGVAVFGAFPFLGVVLNMNSMLQHPSTGRTALDILGLGMDPDIAGDDAFFNYLFVIVPIADLSIATLSALAGGLIGHKLASSNEQSEIVG